MVEFRPIGLLNPFYKIISKLIVHHVKPLLTECIGPSQSSFVPGRNTMDNIILVKEICSLYCEE